MEPRDGRDGAGVVGASVSRVSVRQHLTLSFLWFALNFQSAALVPIVLPVQVLLFVSPGAVGSAQQATFLSWTATGGAVVSLFVPPLIGTLSDRTSGPWGRRRPYVFAGALLLVLAAVLLAAPRTALALIAGLLVFQVGNNVCSAGYQGLLPDLVPQDQRGEASGYIGLMTILGNALSLGLAALLLGAVGPGSDAATIDGGTVRYYALTGVGLTLGALVTVAFVHERPLLRRVAAQGDDLPRPSRRERFDADWLAPWRSRNFRWVFLTRASVMLGISLFMTFIEYYLASVAHVASFVDETAALAVLALVGAAASALFLGILSDHIGRVGLVCFATACMAAAAFAFVVLPPGAPLWPLGLLFGVGFGAYSSVDWALAVDVLPSANAVGKDMGLWTISTTLPALLAFVLGGVTLSIAGALGQEALGYRVVFALAVLGMVAGAVCILLVQDAVTARDAARRPRTPAHLRRRIAPGWRLAFRTRAGRARGFLRFWTFWEWVNHAVKRQAAIPGAPYGLLQVEFIRYQWRPIALPDGTRIGRGDRVAELHINNRLVASRAAETSTWRLMAMFAADMRALAAWASTPDFPPDVRALYGFTLLNRGAARLGFTLRERPRGIRTRLDGFYMQGTLALFNPAGVARLRQGTTYGSAPVEVWMSRDELLRRYAPALVSAPKP